MHIPHLLVPHLLSHIRYASNAASHHLPPCAPMPMHLPVCMSTHAQTHLRAHRQTRTHAHAHARTHARARTHIHSGCTANVLLNTHRNSHKDLENVDITCGLQCRAGSENAEKSAHRKLECPQGLPLPVGLRAIHVVAGWTPMPGTFISMSIHTGWAHSGHCLGMFTARLG